MKIYVCVKNVPDTAANIKVIGDNGFDESVKFLINPYDEYAIEEGLRIKERLGEGKITLVSTGPERAKGGRPSAGRPAVRTGNTRG